MKKSNKVLQVSDVQALIEKALSYTDWSDVVNVVDEIEASFTKAAIEDTLCNVFDSYGVVDYMVRCHEIKHVYYSLVAVDEFSMYTIKDHAYWIMRDMLQSLDKIIKLHAASYKS